MATAKTKMCNQSLTLIGANMVTDFDIPTDENGRLCDLLWDPTVDEVLARHNWKCAIHRKAVAADATAPDFEYETAYSMPSNPYCLRVIRVLYNETEIEDWVREGRKILTNELNNTDEMQIVYIKRITDVSEFTPHLAKAIVWELAVKLAQRRSQATRLVQGLKVELRDILLEAWGVNEMEDYKQLSSNTWQEAGTV